MSCLQGSVYRCNNDGTIDFVQAYVEPNVSCQQLLLHIVRSVNHPYTASGTVQQLALLTFSTRTAKPGKLM